MKISNLHLCLFFLASLACLGFLGHDHALAADPEEIKKLDEELLEQRKKIERVESGLRTHESKVAVSREKEINLVDELEKIDRQLLAENEKLAALQGEMNRQNEMTLAKQKEMEKILVEKETLRHHMEKRLAAYYRMGETGILNTTFSAASLTDLVNLRENFHFMIQYDHQVITDFKNKMVELESAQKVHAQEKSRLEQAARDVMAQQETLAGTQAERQTLLDRVKTEKLLYQQAIKELEAAGEELAATLAKLEEKATEAKEDLEQREIRDYPLQAFKKRKPATAQGFAAEKGKLPPPAAGPIIQKFGQQNNETLGVSTVANGIAIETAQGSDISAVYDGKIVYTGTLRSLGNLIIIDHGNNYFSLVSGVGRIEKKVGDEVKQNDKIGTTSLHGGLLREGLHFEIRHNTEPQDPLEWLEPARISFKN
ncbi:MAG: peptidoglycan DD-metalloendopeptidase family protein [Deltaproteobacteria bacterium]|nr:peptidoglycan DD-metalloendopeptidase family protein [Deltaproteobacteria bacterium]